VRYAKASISKYSVTLVPIAQISNAES